MRAGDVIPQVVSPAPHVVERADRGEPPSSRRRRCPVCETPTVKPEGAVFTKCPNRDCPGRRWQLLKHFASRGAMDIDGLGEKQVALLHAARPRHDGRRLLPPDRRAARGARGHGARSRRRASSRRSSARKERPFGARAVRARHRGRRRGHRPQPRPALPHRRRAAGGDARGDRADAGHRPDRRGADPRAARRTRRCAS